MAGRPWLYWKRRSRRRWASFELKHGSESDVWTAYYAGRGVLISEPLAFRTDLAVGDDLVLDTAAGPRPLEIVGVFYDYSTDRGYALMELALYRSLWNDDGITGVSAYVDEGADLERNSRPTRPS